MKMGDRYPRLRQLPGYEEVADREFDQSNTGPAARSRSEVLARVASCPDRGGVLPVSMQPENCSRCGELSGCRVGKGLMPGRVTLADCLRCKE